RPSALNSSGLVDVTDAPLLELVEKDAAKVDGKVASLQTAAEVLGSDPTAAGGHIFIVGEAGSGKSTLLQLLASHGWDNPKRLELQRPCLPMLVRLRWLAAAEGADPESRLMSALDRSGALLFGQRPPQGFFRGWPEALETKWLLLLDGLDEVPASQRL